MKIYFEILRTQPDSKTTRRHNGTNAIRQHPERLSLHQVQTELYKKLINKILFTHN